MAWPNYHFVDLTKAEKQIRRETINRYALYAQLSALVPVVIILLYRLLRRAASSERARGGYAAVPSSPVLKQRRNSGLGSLTSRGRSVRWWLGEDIVVFGTVLGQRDQWLIGLAWTAWLLVLCVLETGEDYLHLTKRIGSVAVSQWPLQYLLALKSLNPVAYLLRSSHEQVNRWHRVLARITATLISLHAALYIAFFVKRNRLDRLGRPVVIAGIVSFLALNLLITTALRPVRQYSYRLFFIIHVVAGFAIPALLTFHAAPARIFLFEALVVFILDVVSRRIGTVTTEATVESIPGTDLIKISASVPRDKLNRFRAIPGAHIFLSIPEAARGVISPTSTAHLLFEFLVNPFTVAAVDEDTGDLTLIARRRRGPMTTALDRMAGPARPSNANRALEEKIPLSIEGPYGSASRLSRLCSDHDRILLVAGGVGAAFTLPVYQAILTENPSANVEMVWAVRRAGDATWAVTGKAGRALLTDAKMHLYVTGGAAGSDARRSAAGDEELGEELRALFKRGGRYTSQNNRRRPDLRSIVDDVFRAGQEDRVAVLVCGPRSMAQELRAHVGAWVRRGRSVWFHSEGFGY